MRPLLAALALALVAPPMAVAEGLSPIERQLAAAVEGGLDESLALLARAVDLNSGTLNLAGVRAVGDLFAPEFERLGFAVRWVDGAPFERAGHLIAERPGRSTGAPKIVLIGHLDTVFEPDAPFQQFERLSKTEARGPGLIDMKGGIVVMLRALSALAQVDALDRLHLVVVLHGDEERAGRPLELARADLRAAAAGAAAAIGFEDGDGDPRTAVVARRGSSSWRLEVTGTAAHSSQIRQPAIGSGAILETARILAEFSERLAVEADLTFSPGLILGGTQVDFDGAAARGNAFGKNNVVAARAVVTGDLRAVTPEQLARARAAMLDVLASTGPGTTARLEFDEGYPPMGATAGNLELLALYDRVSRDLGLGPVVAVDPRQAGAADVSFIAAAVPMALDGIGLMGTGGHTADETADMTTLGSQARRAALLLHRLAEKLTGNPAAPAR